jgi:hypothetical protein
VNIFLEFNFDTSCDQLTSSYFMDGWLKPTQALLTGIPLLLSEEFFTLWKNCNVQWQSSVVTTKSRGDTFVVPDCKTQYAEAPGFNYDQRAEPPSDRNTIEQTLLRMPWALQAIHSMG